MFFDGYELDSCPFLFCSCADQESWMFRDNEAGRENGIRKEILECWEMVALCDTMVAAFSNVHVVPRARML